MQKRNCFTDIRKSVRLALWLCLASAPSVAQATEFRIGVLTPGGSYDLVWEGLREGLGKLGYREGTDMKFLVEDAKGIDLNFAGRAAKLVEAKPDVIFTVATAPSIAVKQATRTIPVVFTIVSDPVQAGLVDSFAFSRNNVTGISSNNAPLSGKRLEILRQIAPKTKRILALVAINESSARAGFQYLAEAAAKMEIQIARRDVTTKEDVEKALIEERLGAADAVFHVPSVLVTQHIEALIKKAQRERAPAIVYERSHAEMGALVAYGGDFRLFGIQGAKLVSKILKGAKPSEMPIETPERLSLTINMKTAKTIGLRIPSSVLERADRLLESP
jgi:putative tryptophan/tyrosine transport system substrate-binding protein